MYKVIFKTTFFYYILAFIIVFKCINFKIYYTIRLGSLIGYKYSGQPLYKVVLYDYFTRLKPDDDTYWFKLAENYLLLGDYAQAIAAYQKAISINPKEKSYQAALLRCYQLKRKVFMK